MILLVEVGLFVNYGLNDDGGLGSRRVEDSCAASDSLTTTGSGWEVGVVRYLGKGIFWQ